MNPLRYSLAASFPRYSAILTKQLRLPLPSRGRMQQRRHRFPPRNLPHFSRRRHFRLVPPTRRRLHRRLHPRRFGIRLGPTIRRIPGPNPAPANRPRRPLPHDHRRLFHGPRLHDRRE